MNQKTFLILGGYGTTGILIAELLLKETDVRLILTGRNLEKRSFKGTIDLKTMP